MSKFILGVACGVGITLLTPWAHEKILSQPQKQIETAPVTQGGPPAERDWMFDKSRGSLNAPVTKSGR